MIENLQIFGWESAIRGMRNPLNSWARADSKFEWDGEKIVPCLGPNDYSLALSLSKSGPEHRKFLRMIHVQFDVALPRYVWSEFDTYHHNTKNSCSTMHKLLSKDHKIDLSDFEQTDDQFILMHLKRSVAALNHLRIEYLKDGADKNEILHKAKIILPESFLQVRTVDTNYEELRTIYNQRKNHRLKIWRDFCEELKSLPYSRFIVGEQNDPGTSTR